MNKITDLQVYLNRMDAALLDKCWWIDKIPAEINTVIDFGCASGNLKAMIEHLAPGKYNYIGIDDSAEMRAECHKKGINVYASIGEAVSSINPDKTILVMNSVIHEILSYSDTYMALFNQLASYGFRYIAIRDMWPGDPYMGEEGIDALIEAINDSPYAAEWKQFWDIVTKTRGIGYDNLDIALKEFLLKYWYTENWDRECREQYLWYWEKPIKYAFKNYRTKLVEEFYIPYVRDKIYKDFHIEYNAYTHVKVLFELKGEEHELERNRSR